MEYVPVSLGQTAETRFQIVRHLFSRFYPEEPVNVVRWCVFEPEASNFKFEQNIFDQQITMAFAVCEYLEKDFTDIFEKKDLALTGDSLDVIHEQLMTRHPNLFAKTGESLTNSELELGYRAARARIETLAARFRENLRALQPRLYILSEAPAPDELLRLVELLGEKAAHPFHVLVHTRSLEAHANLPILPNVDAFLASANVNKPAAHKWEGDDDEWDRALSGYDFAKVLIPREAEPAGD